MQIKKRAYLARSKLYFQIIVLGAGLEPARGCPHRILSPVRLPIPPSERPCMFNLQKREYKIKNIT